MFIHIHIGKNGYCLTNVILNIDFECDKLYPVVKSCKINKQLETLILLFLFSHSFYWHVMCKEDSYSQPLLTLCRPLADT